MSNLPNVFWNVGHLGLINSNSEIFSTSANAEKRTDMLQKYQDFQQKAEMYYVYHSIQRYTVSRIFYLYIHNFFL